MKARRSISKSSGSRFVRASRSVLEQTTLEDVANGTLPEHVRELATDPDSWLPGDEIGTVRASDRRQWQPYESDEC